MFYFLMIGGIESLLDAHGKSLSPKHFITTKGIKLEEKNMEIGFNYSKNKIYLKAFYQINCVKCYEKEKVVPFDEKDLIVMNITNKYVNLEDKIS